MTDITGGAVDVVGPDQWDAYAPGFSSTAAMRCEN
jgi:hypothetical protein